MLQITFLSSVICKWKVVHFAKNCFLCNSFQLYIEITFQCTHMMELSSMVLWVMRLSTSAPHTSTVLLLTYRYIQKYLQEIALFKQILQWKWSFSELLLHIKYSQWISLFFSSSPFIDPLFIGVTWLRIFSQLFLLYFSSLSLFPSLHRQIVLQPIPACISLHRSF